MSNLIWPLWQTILTGDEFTPDGCRIWDAKTREKLDKDRFRKGMGKGCRILRNHCRPHRRTALTKSISSLEQASMRYAHAARWYSVFQV
ncbi:MAG: phosphoribosylaminoimidazolesuccinocarboxamide synthase [Arenicellales bacterium WSBS_2016_MAG_OTU3]